MPKPSPRLQPVTKIEVIVLFYVRKTNKAGAIENNNQTLDVDTQLNLHRC